MLQNYVLSFVHQIKLFGSKIFSVNRYSFQEHHQDSVSLLVKLDDNPEAAVKGFSRCIVIQLCDLKVGKDAMCWGGNLVDKHFEKKRFFLFLFCFLFLFFFSGWMLKKKLVSKHEKDLTWHWWLEGVEGSTPVKECGQPLAAESSIWLTAQKETVTSVLQPLGTNFCCHLK